MLKRMEKVSTGSSYIDALFKYDSSSLTLIYGEAAAGKTTLALLTTIENAKKEKVIYVDTENGFSVERLKQLAPSYKEFMDNIVHIHPSSLEEQEKIITSLNEKAAKIIIVDTIGFFYRLEVKHDPYKANKSLDNQLRKLNELTKKGVFVLLTNQVYANMEGKIIVVGGDMIRNWCRYLIYLNKNPRRLKVEKPFELEIDFEIKENGIVSKV